LFRQEFLAGISTSPDYLTVREALVNNSIAAWATEKPLLFVHGESDTHVSVTATNTMFDAMINAGTSPANCEMIIYPGLDHGDAVIPSMIQGVLFLINLRDN
jgi:fermentation-respiration switch protein FrsA (DUF1100 family)